MNIYKKAFMLSGFLGLMGASLRAQKTGMGKMDELVLGNSISEKQHAFSGNSSEPVKGALSEPARRLLPLPQQSWMGGRMSFVLKVDALKQNYITVRFWGSEYSENRLYMVVEGRQIGYRHLGDIDMLDVGSDGPFYNDRFYNSTSPLPLSLTKGKKEVKVEIRSQGPIWGYGDTWERYQKNMKEASRNIYKVYVHTSPAYIPSSLEKQGKPPLKEYRKAPGEEVLVQLKQRVNDEIDALVNSKKPLSQVQMQFLAKAWHVKWSKGYHNTQLVTRALSSLDTLYIAYLRNPGLASGDPATYNPEWFGLGISGQVLYLLKQAFANDLNREIEGQHITRKQAYEDMLVACRNWHQRNRRMYTNQSMINDLYGIYFANKGLQNLGSSKALPEKDIRRYLYESLGMQPWLGSDDTQGMPSRSVGGDYMQLTEKGLTKELGYVGNYGEVLDWVTEIYEATKPSLQEEGDTLIRKQVEKIALARSYFRYPMLDEDGNSAMRMETVVGWRDTHYPGDVTYSQRPSWDGGPLQVSAATLHPRLIGYAQQMLEDNQFFSVINKQMKDKGFRLTAGLLPVPDQYEIIKAQVASKSRLPLSWEQPDIVFSDEDDGVVAIKNGKEILYASLYWRARYAINNLARVHYITPEYNNISTVRVQELFDASGFFYTRPDWTNMGFGNGGLRYPDSLSSAHAGERLPIAKIPAGTSFRPGQENPYAGRANYYELQYGKYLIAMNNTRDKSYELKVPVNFVGARNLSGSPKVNNAKVIMVAPMSTVVLYQE